MLDSHVVFVCGMKTPKKNASAWERAVNLPVGVPGFDKWLQNLVILNPI